MRNGALLLLTAGVLACQRPNPGYHPGGFAGGLGGAADSGIPGSGGDTGAAGNTGTGGTTGVGGDLGTGGAIGGTGGAIGGTGGAIGGTGGAIGGTGGAIGGTGGAIRGTGGAIGGTGGAGSGGRGGGGVPGACVDNQDCISGVGPPCGTFQCQTGRCVVVCPNCADTDGDGYGVGTGCAGADCDDSDWQVTTTGSRSCYSGQMSTKDVGVCRSGTQTCDAGVWSRCNGEVLPLPGEACNGEDDDCNGRVDEDLPAIACGIGACARQAASCSAGKPVACLPLAAPATTDGCDGVDNDCDGVVDEDCGTVPCVRVAPSGDDNGADGVDKPFRNIQTAINWAVMPDHPKRVCVAGGAACSDRATYLSPDGIQALVMADGISVYGNYESTTWTRCSLTPAQVVSPGPNVTIQTQTATGVQFPSTVRTPTTLDGFVIARMRGDALPSTAAVTVDGAKPVTLSSLVIADAPNALASWGINLVNGAQALITRSIVGGGAGAQEAIAIRSVGAVPTVRENCSNIDPTSGRCATSACSGLGLRGRSTASGSTSASVGMVVLLKDSPGAVVERNLICGGPAAELSGVRISGPAGGTVVRGNSVFAQGGTSESHGVWIDACGDAAPWIVDNETILGDGPQSASVSAVRAVGACHPVIDSNVRLMAGGEATTVRAVGVVCAAAASSASRCAVVGNKLIQGAPSNHPTQSIGVACDAGACARVAGNVINGNYGADSVGVWVSGGGPLVERNNITGGCGSRSTAGVLADNSAGRIENNLVRGAVCANNLTTTQAVGVRVHVAAGGNEVDVHSNTIDAGGAGTCNGAAALLGTTATANTALRKGVFRNNILRVGTCSTVRYGFWESNPPVEPRIFENNDLDPTGSPTALYLDANTTALTTEAAVNALTGTVVSGNISADPMFVAPPSDLRISSGGSRCVDTGTAAGAPARDYAGRMRDAKPDIGAYER